MSATTVTKHQPTELRYEGTANGVAVFSSASKSRPGTRNWTYVTTDNLEVACECQAKSGTCWHGDLALTAYAMTQVADFIASKADDELLAIGAAAAEAIATNRHTATDVAVCWQARAEWLARREAVAAARAVVAEWESLSYSDRHIDRHFDGRRGEREYDAARSALHRLETLAA